MTDSFLLRIADGLAAADYFRKKREFRKSVKYFANPKDYEANKRLLSRIKPRLHGTFIQCLKMGATIPSSKQAVELLNGISRTLRVSPEECLRLAHRFRLVNGFLDGDMEDSIVDMGRIHMALNRTDPPERTRKGPCICRKASAALNDAPARATKTTWLRKH